MSLHRFLRNIAQNHLRTRAAFIVGMAIFLSGGNLLHAATTNFNWIGPTADYSFGSYWDRGSVPNGSANYVVMITNGGTVGYTSGDNFFIGQMCVAPSNNCKGTFEMVGGTLLVSNNSTLIPLFLGGYGSGTSTSPSIGTNSVGVLTVSGGTLNIVRNLSSAYYKDGVDLGVCTNGSGTLTVSGGTVNLLCGMEIGVFGTGTVNVSGGALIDNSWFGIGRGSSGPNGSGFVNVSSNGTLYLVRNINTESDNTHGFYFCVAGTNGVANISGGSIYANRVSFAANSLATEILNMSGGNFYIGSDGVSSSSSQAIVNISGGTFHTANMVTNGTVITLKGNPYTVGNCDTNSVLPGGTNWTWTTYPSVNLTTSIPGMGGVGYVTFAPEAGQTITLDNAWSGNGGLTLNGPGTLAIAGSNTYSGNTTVSQGTLQIIGGGTITSPNIIVASGATFAGPASSPPFTMIGGQTLSNSGSTPTFGGDINTGSGTLSLTYSPGTPAFTVVNGTLGLSTSTGVQVNNTGSALAAGNYLLISAGSGGLVALPGGVPAVTVSGGGVVAGQFAYLTVVSNSLYLSISTNRPPIIANAITNTLFYGATWQIAVTNLAALAGWSDPGGQAIGLSSVGPSSANGVNVSSDGTNIYYNGILTANDYFNYTITNNSLSAVGSVYLNEIEPTAAIPSDTNFVLSLDGSWRFYFERSNYNLGTPPNVVLPPDAQPFQQVSYVEGPGWTNLTVPGDWEMAGFSPCTYFSPDDTCGLYRNWIQIPQSWQGRRVYLYMDAVQDGAEIWLNGQPVPVNESSWGIVNYHESGWTGFQVDLTSQVQFGTTNLLAVRVIKSTPSDDLDTGDYFVLGGINRPVTLYSVPQINIADYQVQTTLPPNNSAQVTVTADVTGGDATTPVSMFLNGVETDTAATNGQVVFTQTINQPRLWSCEFPNLYALTLQLKDTNGHVTETVTNHIGIRQLTITNGVLYLNGVPVKFAGICDHDSSPTVGSAVDANFWRKEILLMKAANINAIRTTHFPFDSAFYDVCDELGMYVSDELPYCWCDPEVGEASMTPAFQQRARETIRRDRNHPCVVIWAVGNENSAGNNLQIVADLIKSEDASRPRLVSTFNAAQYNVELSDAHYPSISGMQSDAANAQSTGHPFIFLENPNTMDERLGADAGFYEDWGLVLQRVWNVCQQYSVIPGTFPFEWSDRAVQDPNSNASYTQYHNTGVQLLYYFPATGVHLLKMKGVVDSFRDERPSVYEIQEIYSPIQVSNSLSVTSGQVSFPIQNRYAFTDLSYLTTAWQLERNGVTIASGNTNLSLPPLTSGTAQLSMPSNALAYADTLRLDFIHPNGNDILTYQFTLMNPGVSSQMTTNLPPNLPIPTFNLVVRSNYSNPLYWTECERFPAGLSGVVLTPPNATNLAQLTSLSATVIGGPNNSQILGSLTASYTNNSLSYTLNWTGPTWDIQELGWIFQMPTNCDQFSWNRTGRWTFYPDSDICRASGTATPDSTNTDATDMNIPNAFDFNSTKYNCNWAGLTDANGQGLRLQSGLIRSHCRAGAATNGAGYLLYFNQQVSMPNDISANIVSDLYLTFQSGDLYSGSFSVGSNSNLVSNAAGSLNGSIVVSFPMSGGTNGNEGPVQLSFDGNTNTSYSVWASTNLATWQWEGAATQNGPGLYQFLDVTSTNYPERFYRISSP